jgi:2,3-bisphosphoglycerate-independent phosphoglycerate mutase
MVWSVPCPCAFFDLLRLFDRFSCSKITQILTLEHEVVAMSVSKKPMVLVILDGYGYREDSQDNAIFNAKTPVMDALWAKRPHTLIDASGLEVGLPDRQMGNSEVGHVNLGAGRIVYQDLTRLDVEIKERTFFSNPTLSGAVDKAVAAGKAVHIMGLLSAGGVHSHEDHIMAMVELAAERGAEKSICTPSWTVAIRHHAAQKAL